ncbi:S-layer homology domain-containing protein [Aneurinibacillus sp. BA2021]|nr:S-layer homology domain-containing protein [Aneurinibacillus sp. BA2021]
MLRKLLILLLLCTLAFPLSAFAQMKEKDGEFYFYDPNYGFIVKLITPNERNVTTNIVDEIKFELFWYDYQNTYHRRDPIQYAKRVNPSHVHVYYKDPKAMSSVDKGMVLLDDNSYIYTIRDYQTGKDKTGAFPVNIAIENLISPTKTKTKNPAIYHGDGSKQRVSINIDLMYYQKDKEGGKFYTSFKAGKSTMFEKRLELEFPKETYITDPAMSTVLPEQDILVSVNSRPANTSEYMFVSQSYIITDKYERSSTRPSQGGTIRLMYDDGLSIDGALHNLSILQKKDGKWIPIGGKVDSRNNMVEAPIEEFGEYAAAVMYKTYKLDMVNNWSKPYVLALAYKGVIQPEMYLFDGRLLKDLNANISRFDFIMMLARAKGLKPVQYNGHFVDVTESAYGKSMRGYDGTGYLMSAVKSGFVQGKTSGVLGNVMAPEAPLTREEAAVFVSRALNLKVPTYSDMTKSKERLKKNYRDYASVSGWAVPHVEALTKKKFMQGSNGLFKPHDKLTVAEASVLVYNMMDELQLFGK